MIFFFPLNPVEIYFARSIILQIILSDRSGISQEPFSLIEERRGRFLQWKERKKLTLNKVVEVKKEVTMRPIVV